MGYGYYLLPDGREAGYTVEAICDADGCNTEIDRGMDYLCGCSPDGRRDPNEPGCGKYHCEHHKYHHDCPKKECGAYPCPDCEEGLADPCWLLTGHTGGHENMDGHVFRITETDCTGWDE